MNPLHKVLWVSTLLVASELQAQRAPAPTSGMLYSSSEPGALKFECTRASESHVTCNFTQLRAYNTKYPSVESSLR